MTGEGDRIFADELARFAAGCANARVTAIAERTAAPLRVVVHGRPGAGRGTVARALGAAGPAVSVTQPGAADADAVVHVLAEVVKPEDAEAIAAARRPVLPVLNKADLVGSLSGRGGAAPAAAVRDRCALLSATAGVAVEPMIAVLAVAALDGPDDTVWTALRALAEWPGHAGLFDDSCDGFLAAEAPVPADVRARLLATLDLFGTALGVAAVRRGRTPAQLRALLRQTSGVDAVMARLWSLGAEARYRRVLDAVTELEALAVGADRLAERIGGFLAHDDTVLARMAAAVEAAGAVGLEAGLTDDHLPRAVRWQRYGRAPVSGLHRSCGADIVRGSLRLWSRAGGPAPAGEVQ